MATRKITNRSPAENEHIRALHPWPWSSTPAIWGRPLAVSMGCERRRRARAYSWLRNRDQNQSNTRSHQGRARHIASV
jgi:hypothetical protein